MTAEDVGIDVNDMEFVFKETEFVTGVHQVHGGSGDPSPFTAYGALQGLMATLHSSSGSGRRSWYAVRAQATASRRRPREAATWASRSAAGTTSSSLSRSAR
jgi:hypothetical protein